MISDLERSHSASVKCSGRDGRGGSTNSRVLAKAQRMTNTGEEEGPHNGE